MRFYGGTPVSWLQDTPLALLAAHTEMIGRLQAEEAMSAATQIGVGHRMKPGNWISQQWNRWKRAASDSRPVKALPGDLTAVGIGVREVKRDG